MYNTGIGGSTIRGYLIEGNYIKMTPGVSASYGTSHANGTMTGSQAFLIIGNTFENCGTYGIRWSSTNITAGQSPSKIINNYFKPTFLASAADVMNLNVTRNVQIYHNTMLMNIANGNGVNAGTTANYVQVYVKNNIIQLQHPSATGVCVFSEGGTIDSCDYNAFIKSNPADPTIIKLRGVFYSNNNVIGGGGYNNNSYLDNPQLLSLTNPAPRNICQKGQSALGVANDINYATRLVPPQVGCSEPVPGLANDAAVTKFVLPQSYPVYSGAQDIKVIIKNTGGVPLTSVNITVSLGGTNFSTIGWTGNLNSCATDTVIFTGANQLTLLAGSNTGSI